MTLTAREKITNTRWQIAIGKIKEIILKHIDKEKYQVFLFGSRATGNADEKSDYDIGIYGKEKVPLKTLAKIDGEIEKLPIPVDIEIVDFRRVSQDFKDIALKKIKIWNEPKIDIKLP